MELNIKNIILAAVLALGIGILFVNSTWARRIKSADTLVTNLSLIKREDKIRELIERREELNGRREQLTEELKQLEQKRDLAREYLKGAVTVQGRRYLGGVIAKCKVEIKSGREELEEISKQTGAILREIYKLEGVIK